MENAYRAARLKAGFTAYEAARLLGVTPPALYMWETGRNKPNGENIVKLANLYGCNPEDLLKK